MAQPDPSLNYFTGLVVSATNIRVYDFTSAARTMTLNVISAYTTVGFGTTLDGTMITLGLTATTSVFKFFSSWTLAPLLYSFRLP